MYGVIFGDIAGSKFEGGGRTEEAAVLIKNNSGLPMPIGGSFYTDDTVLSIAVADALLIAKSEGALGDDVRVSELTEACLRKYGLAYPAMSYGGRFSSWLFDNAVDNNNSCGNGSAMRVSAAGLIAESKEEAERLAKAVAIPTHSHPEGVKGAVCTAVLTYMAGTGATKQELYDEARKFYDVDFRFYDKSIASYGPGIWVCQGTLPVAIRAFLESESYEDMIRKCIGFGGDTDTLAAIAGAFGGVYYGIPEEYESYVRTALESDTNKDCPLLPILDKFLGDGVVRNKMDRQRQITSEPFTKVGAMTQPPEHNRVGTLRTLIDTFLGRGCRRV